jgi:hypothetical protein
MKETDNNMDKVFRDKLGDFQKQPPDEIWNGIKAGLANKPNRMILIPLWQAAAGMALIITAGSIFFYLNRPVQNEMVGEISTSPQILQDNPQIQNSGSPEIAKEINTVTSPGNKPDIKSLKGGSEPEKSGLAIIPESEKPIVSGDLQEFIAENRISGSGSPYLFSPGIMTDPYLQSAHPDIIPRNRKTFTASWDMLTAGVLTNSDEDENFDRLNLTAQVSPTYSYRDLGSNGVSASEQFNNYESGRISYSGGMQFGYQTSERLSIHAGLMFAQLGYNVNQVGSYSIDKSGVATEVLNGPEQLSTVYAAKNSIGTIGTGSEKDDFIGVNGSRDGNEYFDNIPVGVTQSWQIVSDGKIEQFFQYLEIPFLLRYKIFDHKLGVNLLGGISTNILIGNRATLITDDQTSDLGSSGDIRNFNYMGNMGLGFDYNISKNLLFTMEPQFKYFLNSINQDNLISNRPYMLGMFTGVKFVW